MVAGGEEGGRSQVIDTEVAVNDRSVTRIGGSGKSVGVAVICE